MSPKANFFVVGAAKAGTTSLYHYLSQHQEVYVSPIKEPNYFSTDINPDTFSIYYNKNIFTKLEQYFSNKPLQPIQLAFIRDKNQYNALFSGSSNKKAIGEFSTSYLFSEKAALNIYEYNPNARIIVCLRNPIDRAYSHYLMALRYGFTTLSFKEALEKDMQKPIKGWGISELFIELGMYQEQLQRFFEVFPRKQIKVILYDDFLLNPQSTLNNLCPFLGISPYSFNTTLRHNKAATPRFKHFNRLLIKSGIKQKFKRVLPKGIFQETKKLFFSSSDLKKINDTDKAFLQQHYKKNILEVSGLINIDLSHWLE